MLYALYKSTIDAKEREVVSSSPPPADVRGVGRDWATRGGVIKVGRAGGAGGCRSGLAGGGSGGGGARQGWGHARWASPEGGWGSPVSSWEWRDCQEIKREIIED
ncbi:hypothetical protein L484_023206 [Morus notabilis]|uniref:Uncharacterized protein n=1 Tax=Morus notabilis TaxID=981085 RepID=W9S6S7_9ROSA|nr:hypothetical protein L484_023206 [Morus notabilis]